MIAGREMHVITKNIISSNVGDGIICTTESAIIDRNREKKQTGWHGHGIASAKERWFVHAPKVTQMQNAILITFGIVAAPKRSTEYVVGLLWK